MNKLKANNDVLFRHLRHLKKNDLKIILNGGLRVAPRSILKLKKEELVLLCSKELRAAASSSTKNVFRDDHSFPYKQILIDVADKLSPGHTVFGWTDYKLEDVHTEAEIEDTIAELFEARAKSWWNKLSKKNKTKFVGGINAVVGDEHELRKVTNSGAFRTFVSQQMIENVIQTGIISGLSKVAASGAFGTLGVSVISQLGWLIVLNTVGWMGGIKIALFGIAGHGAFGGAIAGLGGVAIGGILSIPTLFALADGPAYRKTVPTVVMLIARNKVALLN